MPWKLWAVLKAKRGAVGSNPVGVWGKKGGGVKGTHWPHGLLLKLKVGPTTHADSVAGCSVSLVCHFYFLMDVFSLCVWAQHCDYNTVK